MKKYICSLIAFLMTAFMLFSLIGCGGKGENEYGLNPKKPITLTVWHYYNGMQLLEFNDMVDEFNDSVGQKKGIIIESLSKGSVNTLISELLLAAKDNDEPFPDIYAAYADTAYQLDKSGRVADLSPYLSESEKNSFVSAYFKEGAFNSKDEIKIFPTVKSTESLFLNYTAWQSFASATGASEESLKTWEGLSEVAESYYNWTDMQTPDIPHDGKAFFGRDAFENYLLIGSMQLGVEIFEVNDGEITFNIDESVFRKLWDNYYVPYINGYFVNKGRFSSDDIKTGDILAFVGSTTSITYFPTEIYELDKPKYDVEAKILPLPNFANTQPFAVQQGAGMAVNKMSSTREYAAMIFLKWFTESERNLNFSINSGYLPVKTDINSETAIENAFLDFDFDKIDEITDPELKIETIKKYRTMQTLKVGINTAKNYTLYTNKAFTNGTAARAVIQSTMSTLAKTDAADIAQRLEKGENKTEILKEYLADEYFQTFLTNLRNELNALQS